MDFVWRIAEYFLVLSSVAVMLYAVAMAIDSVGSTERYVSNQNNSDAYANRYASLSSFDADSVGKISVQEALNLIYTYAQDSSPVIVQGPDNVVHVYVTDTSGWIYSSNGKPLGYKIDASGNYYNGTYDTSISPLQLATEPVPEYKNLYNYLSNNQLSEVFYLANINPTNEGNLETILLKATN